MDAMVSRKEENKKLFRRKITLYVELISSIHLTRINIAIVKMKYFKSKNHDYENSKISPDGNNLILYLFTGKKPGERN